MIWAYLIHLGTHMWEDKYGTWYTRPNDFYPVKPRETLIKRPQSFLCQKEEWVRLTTQLAEMGLNTLIIDLGEGVQYKSHPELAVEGSWTVEELKEELARLRSIGLNPIPKLNFSAAHDEWLGEYQKMVSTQKYYEVCADIIAEVCDIFDTPDYLHIGMDEEAYAHQKSYGISIVRHGELWWHDALFLIDEVQKHGVTPWMWSDQVLLGDMDEFVQRMPKNVMQSIWYYGGGFGHGEAANGQSLGADFYKFYAFLDKHGYKQVPTGSLYMSYNNMENLGNYCKIKISPENLAGFMVAPWQATTKDHHYYNLANADVLRQVKEYTYFE